MVGDSVSAGATPAAVFGRGGRFSAQTRTPAAATRATPPAIHIQPGNFRRDARTRVAASAMTGSGMAADGAIGTEAASGAAGGKTAAAGCGAGRITASDVEGGEADGVPTTGEDGATIDGALSGRFCGTSELLKKPPGMTPERAAL